MLTFWKKTLCYSASTILFSSIIAFDVLADDREIIINIGEEGISIAADNEKLSNVLVKLGDQTDIEVTGANSIDATFNGQISGRDVEELLKLLRVNSILIWDNTSKERKLREMILLSASEEDSSFLPAGNTGVVATTNSQVISQQQQQPSTELELSQAYKGNAVSSVTNSETSPSTDITNSDASESPGFGFSIDPYSATINPQQ